MNLSDCDLLRQAREIFRGLPCKIKVCDEHGQVIIEYRGTLPDGFRAISHVAGVPVFFTPFKAVLDEPQATSRPVS